VEARHGWGAKEAQQWTEGNETGAEKIGRNCKKKTQKTQKQTEKKNTAKHQNKNRDVVGGG
jgi:hypothetical protein